MTVNTNSPIPLIQKPWIRYASTIIVLVIMVAVFIFSSQQQEQSESLSFPIGDAMWDSGFFEFDLFNPIRETYEQDNVPFILFVQRLVRKLAHFCEFFVLGCILSLLLPLRPAMRLLAAGLGLLTGLIDETIQIFSGRGDQISDVWLDFSGAALGILLTSLLLLLLRRKRPHTDSPALK